MNDSMTASMAPSAWASGAQAMPAPTWHRLHVNDADVSLPEGLFHTCAVEVELDGVSVGVEGDFESAVAALQADLDAAAPAGADGRAVVKAAEGRADAADLDVPALSSYQRRAVLAEVAGDVAAAFETGMGPEAAAALAGFAEGRIVLRVAAGEAGSATVRIPGVDGHLNVAAIDLIAEEGAQARLAIVLDSPEAGTGAAACELRVFSGPRADVEVSSFQTLDDGWTALDDSGFILARDAKARISHRVLGAGASYTGLAADLRGEASRIEVDTRYIGVGEQRRDFNYSIKQRGRNTESELDANGVLAGRSSKTLRGTIDFVHGCKGSTGSERETVLLADEGVVNKTVPVILCDEDDVMGNHGATIGHVRPEQRFYLAARGFSEKDTERLFAAAALEEAHLATDDAQVRAGIERLSARLGIAEDGLADHEEAIA